MTGHVPDNLFRLSEARASVALAGRDVPFDAVLAADLSDAPSSADIDLVHRAATALSTGWQHTARRKGAPPPVVEINAALTGLPTNGTSSTPPRRLAPVRALNPLIEIGLEHVMLAGGTDRQSDLVARAVTAVEVGRAARLSRPFLTLSPRLLEKAGTYRLAIGTDLTDPGPRDQWLQLLCSCVALASGDCADKVTRLDQLRARYREQADDPRLLPLIDLLLARPSIDADLVVRRLSVSEDVAAGLLSWAGDAGWLQAHPHLHDVLVAEQVISLFHHSHDDHQHDSQHV